MIEDRNRGRIETKAIVISYAMSRLDRDYLKARKLASWNQAFAEAENALAAPGTSFKNLRDEFDWYTLILALDGVSGLYDPLVSVSWTN